MAEFQKATLAAGCFWCIDAVLQQTKGVRNVVSGYTGGDVDDPTYEMMHKMDTGHAEAVQFEYDSDVITYDVLLDIFWIVHNPTTLNQDGANKGREYRSEIFYHTDEQKKIAEESIKTSATALWDDPIVTKITKFEKFYSAEDYHQNYFNKQPEAPYCQIIINPKLEKFRARFSDYIRT